MCQKLKYVNLSKLNFKNRKENNKTNEPDEPITYKWKPENDAAKK